MPDPAPPRTRASVLGTALAIALLLAGCGGAGEAADAPDADGSTARPAPASGSAGGVVSAVSAQEVCDVLVATQPELAGASTDEGMVTIALALAALYSEQGALEGMNGADLDAMTTATCPEARDAALASAGITSFMQM